MHRISIQSLQDPRVAIYRDQRDAWLRVQADADRGRPSTGLPDGLFMAEGELVVEQALGSRHSVRSILGTPNRLDALVARVGSISTQIPIYVAAQELMDGIAGFAIHRGLLACVAAAPQPQLEDLLAQSRTLVVLEDLSNHDNVGGIFRNVAALGGDGAAVLLSPRCCDPLYRKAIRVSMGHAMHVPFVRVARWPEDLERAISAGFQALALTPDPEAEPLGPIPTGRVAVLLGAEGPGLTDAALGRAHRRVRIPIGAGVNSLNVSVTVAVALDRLARGENQREP